MQRTSTTRLPASLREQIDKGGSQKTRKRMKQVVTRKEGRKEERQQLKQRRAAFFFSRTKYSDFQSTLKRPANHHQENEPVKKKIRLTEQSAVIQQPHTKLKDTPTNAPTLRSQRSLKGRSSRATSEPNLRGGLPSRRSLSNIAIDQSREDRAEDAEIAWLEAKLGITKGSNKPKKSISYGDGLDDLMDEINQIMPLNTLSSVHSSESQDYKGSEVSEFTGFSIVEWNGEKDEDTPLTESQMGKTDVISAAAPDDQMPPDEAQITAQPSAGKYHTTGLGGGLMPPLPEPRYIPPPLRHRTNDGSEALSKLSRQIKGLLNRLSEQNIASILVSIEDLYRSHRRHDVTSTLTTLILDGIASHSSHLDSFVVLHASLVTSLYKIIGVDFAAHFIQFLITSYELHYHVSSGNNSYDSTGDEPRRKECLNLVVLLSELYNFQVISCVLVYDVIRGLLHSLNEFDVELLLKIARNSGQQLRHDDPSALKDIIQIVLIKMSTKQQDTISSRTRFMIETLTNLKNNKVRRVAGQDGRSESVERMKKFLSGLAKKQHVMAHEPLRINLDDLHSSEKKGKWWLVGSAWGGDPLLDRTLMENRKSTWTDPSVQAADSLLQLARKQGMNTDVRRGIFVALMGSDDYVDACERLSQLNLTELQQREIVRVILHCLGNEKQYNPYYTLVVRQLCQTSHSYKVTLQFCLWDFLRDLGEKGVGGAEIIKDLRGDETHIPFDSNMVSPTRRLNVARAYAWWVAKGCCSLTILKPVDFTALQTQTRDFFRDFFFQLFISSQVSSPAISCKPEAAEYLTGLRIREPLEEVFIKATRVPTLTQGLIYFLTSALRGNNRIENEVVSQTLTWARDVARDTLRAGMNVVASLK